MTIMPSQQVILVGRLVIIIPGRGVSGNRAVRFTSKKTSRGKCVYRPKDVDDYLWRVRAFAEVAAKAKQWCPLVYFGCRVAIYNTTFDSGNRNKPFFDALQGIAYYNDKYMLEDSTRMYIDPWGPRISVEVYPVDPQVHGYAEIPEAYRPRTGHDADAHGLHPPHCGVCAAVRARKHAQKTLAAGVVLPAVR
jgi:hypothetical protein